MVRVSGALIEDGKTLTVDQNEALRQRSERHNNVRDEIYTIDTRSFTIVDRGQLTCLRFLHNKLQKFSKMTTGSREDFGSGSRMTLAAGRPWQQGRGLGSGSRTWEAAAGKTLAAGKASAAVRPWQHGRGLGSGSRTWVAAWKTFAAGKRPWQSRHLPPGQLPWSTSSGRGQRHRQR